MHIGLDQLGALVIAYTVFNLPFAIWLMYSFFQDIPKELEDSARLDGYGRLQVLWRVVLPLAAPGIAVTAIFSLLFAWNEFLFAISSHAIQPARSRSGFQGSRRSKVFYGGRLQQRRWFAWFQC